MTPENTENEYCTLSLVFIPLTLMNMESKKTIIYCGKMSHGLLEHCTLLFALNESLFKL
jgi:hypothetical protein